MSYAFEGNFNDGSGKGNNGTVLVNAVVATDPALAGRTVPVYKPL